MGLQQPNMWTVASYMEQIYMATGSIPSGDSLQSEFPGMDESELDAGEMLFYEKIGGPYEQST